MPSFQAVSTGQSNIPQIEIDNIKFQKKSKSKPKRSKSKKKNYVSPSKHSQQEKNQNFTNHNDDPKGTITKTTSKNESFSFKAQNNFSNNGNNGGNQLVIEKQVKLNYFLRKKNQNGDSLSIGSQTKFALPQFQRKKRELQEQIKQKDQVIQKLKKQKQYNFERYTKLKVDFEEGKSKGKYILQQRLRQAAENKRKQKAEINSKMGYYKQASWTMFIQGDYIVKSKKNVQSIQEQIKFLEEKKRNSKQDDRDRLSYQIDFLKKAKFQAIQILRTRQVQLTIYKDRLRLADKQSSCTFAKNNWPLLNQRYLPMELIGSGGFGQVYKCYDLEQNKNVALKTNCFEPNKSPEHRQEFIKHVKREIQTLKSLNHPNIARLFEEIEIQNHKISYIMQYCSGPELSKYLLKQGNLEQKQAKGIIKQLSFALKYMFEQKYRIIHYDLKPANIIFHHGTVKILDFGLCKRMQSEQTKMDLTSQGVGTYWYLPPQTFKPYPEISSKVDVWSMGVIFFELLYGRKPFGHGINQNKVFADGLILKAQKVEFPVDKKFKVSEEAKQFIRDCLRYDPQDRLDPVQVYQHAYLTR